MRLTEAVYRWSWHHKMCNISALIALVNCFLAYYHCYLKFLFTLYKFSPFQEVKENDKMVPYFIIRVHLANDAEIVSSQIVGWNVTRSLSAFHSLHQKLVPVSII